MPLELYNIRIEPDIIEKLETLAAQEHIAARTLARSLLSKKVEESMKRGRK
jgi:hypothetical protein